MAILVDEVNNFPRVELTTKTGQKVWAIAKGLPHPFLWRVRDAIGVLTGKYEAFRYLTQDVMGQYENMGDMKRQPKEITFIDSLKKLARM